MQQCRQMVSSARGPSGDCTSRMSLPERSAVMTRVQGGLQQGQGVMRLQGPTHLAGQAEGHQLRNRQHLHCRAKGVPAPSPARHCLARDSSFFVHCLFTFLLFICLFVPFAFHEYIVTFHTPSITGEGLITAVVSQDNQKRMRVIGRGVKGLAQSR